MSITKIPNYELEVSQCTGNVQQHLYLLLAQYVGDIVQSNEGTFLIVSVTPNGFVHYGSNKIDSFKTFMQKF